MKMQPVKKVKDVARRIRRNDAADRLQFITVASSAVIVYLSYMTSLGVVWSQFSLMGVVLLYLAANIGYSVSKTLSDRQFYRKESQKSEQSAKDLIKQRSRGGQYVGLATVLSLLLLNLLVALRVPIPFNIGEGRFVIMDEAIWVATSATVAIIGAASVAKIIQREQARYTHNSLLLYMTTASTFVYGAWMLINALGGDVAVPSDYLWNVYIPILTIYVVHNMVLAGWLEEEDKGKEDDRHQKHWGDLVGTGAMLLNLILIVLSSFNDIFNVTIIQTLPLLDIYGLFLSTLFIFVVSISRRDWVAEIKARRKKRQAHEETHNLTEDTENCIDCNNST